MLWDLWHAFPSPRGNSLSTVCRDWARSQTHTCARLVQALYSHSHDKMSPLWNPVPVNDTTHTSRVVIIEAKNSSDVTSHWTEESISVGAVSCCCCCLSLSCGGWRLHGAGWQIWSHELFMSSYNINDAAINVLYSILPVRATECCVMWHHM